MIYTGTFPPRPVHPDQFNAINQGDTGRGKVARLLTKPGKDSGRLRLPAQAWTGLGFVWEFNLTDQEKGFWFNRVKETWYPVRSGEFKPITGFALFLLSNTAAFCVGEPMLRVPPWETDNYVSVLEVDSISARTNQLKLYSYFQDWDPETWMVDYFISVIHPDNILNADPLRNTELLCVVHPNESISSPPNPTKPQYFNLPWMVNAGNVVGVFVMYRYGSQNFPPGYWAGSHDWNWWEITVD